MKAIIFDFDWVIADTFDLVLEIHNKVNNSNISSEEYKAFFDWNFYSKSKTTKEQANSFFNEVVKHMKELRIEENIKNHLTKLKENFDLYIISSNWEAVISDYFYNNNLENLFDWIYWFETHKSKTEKFKIIFDKHWLNNENSIFITDTLWDILEAKKVWIKTIAVDFWYHDRERLLKWKPHKIIYNFEDILNSIL